MALFEKFQNKIIVPWFNRNEWYYVYKLLYSCDSDYEKKTEAFNILKIWKTRMHQLSAGLEGTYIILQVIIEHPGQKDNLSCYDIQILYSTAIMRFLNICVAHDSKQGTFYEMARKRKIPNWIISLRHDTAHGSNLPPFTLLQKATNFAYEWLYNEYWYPVSLSIYDYKEGLNESEFKVIEEKLQFLISVFECMITCKLSKCNIKKVDDIPDIKSRQDILYYLKEYDRFPKVTEETNLKDLMNMLSTYICNYFNEINIEKSKKDQVIVNILLNGDVFLCAPELIETLLESRNIEVLPYRFVKEWRKLFSQLEILDTLFLSLIRITTIESESHLRKTIACLWIIELAKAIHYMNIFSHSTHSSKKKDSELNQVISLQTSMEDCYENYFHVKSTLILNIHHDLPSVIKNLDTFQQEVLEKPTKYTKKYLPYLLNIIKPPLPYSSKVAIQELVNVYVESSFFLNNEVPDKIYSGADLDQFSNKNDLQEKGFCSEISQEQSQKIDSNIIENYAINTIWQKVSDNVDFSTTPLGLLPWQESNKNPTLTMQQFV